MQPALDLQAQMQTAVGHHRAGRFQEAVALYERVLGQHPDQPDALHLLGLALNRLGHPAEALVHVQRAVELVPGHPGFQFSLGNLLLEADRAAEAEPALRAALAAAPTDAGARNALAVALGKLDRIDEACAELRAMLAAQPDDVPTLDNLAALLLKRKGKETAAEAEGLAQRALALRPGGAVSLNNLGAALVQLGRFAEAEPVLLQATQARADFAEAWYNLGITARSLHKNLAADGALRQALRLAPDNVSYLLAAGAVAGHLGLGNESLAMAQRAYELDPQSVDVLVALAAAWRDQNEYEEAERLLRAALAKRDTAYLRSMLGHLLWEAGDHDAMRIEAAAAIALDPDICEPRLTLANSGRVTSLDDENVREALRLIAKPDLREEERMALCYALGKSHDDVGDHATAFRWYHEGNELKKGQQSGYLPEVERQFYASCSAAYTRERVAALQPYGSQSEAPVFVFGLPRSGTSLAEQIIASHPAAHGAGELMKIREIGARLSAASLDRGGPDLPEALWSLPPTELAPFAQRYLDRLWRGVDPTKLRIVDKMPLNLKNLGLIATLFPKARFVHCMRNPVDNCLSMYFQNFGRGNEFANDLTDVGDFYAACSRLADYWKQALPIQIFELPYEGVVEDPELWARRLIEAIGLPWDPRCLEFHKTERVVRTASAWQVKQPIYKRSAGRWKRYGEALKPLLDELRAEGIAFE